MRRMCVRSTNLPQLVFRDLLDEARDYHLMPERRPLLQSFKTKPRRCKDLAGVIYAVGGQTKSGNSLSTVEVSPRSSFSVRVLPPN